MLKISQVNPVNHALTLRVEGRLVGPWVQEARNACERVLSEGRSLKLDLGEVSFVDQEGIKLLSMLRSRGVELIDCSPFVEEQLKC